VVVGPEGDRAFALTSDGRRLVQVDLLGGGLQPLAEVPGEGLALAVAGDRVYVVLPYRNVVWVFDRAAGAAAGAVPVGRRPLGILARRRPGGSRGDVRRPSRSERAGDGAPGPWGPGPRGSARGARVAGAGAAPVRRLPAAPEGQRS
jgi:hypothetical protein